LLLLAGQKILNSHLDRNVSVAFLRQNYFKKYDGFHPRLFSAKGGMVSTKKLWFNQALAQVPHQFQFGRGI
jgi:hypothetical protein